MADPAKKKATYEDLFDLPENMTGEIIDGELILSPRPSRKHVLAATIIGSRLTPPYYFGEGDGPGGWVILIESEISLGEDILVPDLGGWRKERFPKVEEHNWISVAPDWVCEILSPRSARIDKTDKMSLYAEHGVSYLWLIDPDARTLDVFQLESGKWMVLGLYVRDDKVRPKPFQETTLDLADLWME